jgi:hypothetical protein
MPYGAGSATKNHYCFVGKQSATVAIVLFTKRRKPIGKRRTAVPKISRPVRILYSKSRREPPFDHAAVVKRTDSIRDAQNSLHIMFEEHIRQKDAKHEEETKRLNQQIQLMAGTCYNPWSLFKGVK